MKIEAAILTHSNQSGLNALLWAIYNQTRQPDGITIYLTGPMLNDPQLLSTIMMITKKIPIEIASGVNVMEHGFLHYGRVRKNMFYHLKVRGKKRVWLLEDDLIPIYDCLENQVKHGSATIPRLIEEDRSSIPHEKRYYNVLNSKKDLILCRGSCHGLLVDLNKLLKVKLDKFYIFEDTELVEKVKPIRVYKAKMLHTRKTTSRQNLIYAFVENLYHGDLK